MFLPALAAAQGSASYTLTEHVFNNGGGEAPRSSPGFTVTLDAIGDMASAAPASSGSFRLQGTFVASFRPPGEVQGLSFLDPTTLAWQPEPSAVEYEVYRSDISLLLSGDTGICLAPHVPGQQLPELSAPAVGQGWFYLVTARNRLGEEGTKAFRSDGSQRPNPMHCP